MPKFTVRLERPATDFLYANIVVEAESAAAAEALAQMSLDAPDAFRDAMYDLEFAFDQCGEMGEIEVTSGFAVPARDDAEALITEVQA